ncbi:MAG: hypothetical protein ABI741_00160 [Ferruginibacter sp.]
MKKKSSRAFFIILLILPLVVVAHFFIFPQETRCMLVRFAAFEKKENIYFRSFTAAEKINTVLDIRTIAEKRVHDLWGMNTVLDYQFIYCNNEKDFNNYGRTGTPAATQLKMGAYIVLKEESLDIDIIAHEISHTVLYNNTGWYKTKFKIPTWFDEGLAMQVDDRHYYSIDSLKAKKNAGAKLPDILQMKTPADFFSGSAETVMLNFSTAKYTIHEWLQTHSLQKFIEAINNGEGFEKAYR